MADTREAFEAQSALDDYRPLRRNSEEGNYTSLVVETCWAIWQAALASRPAEVDDPFGPQRFLNWNRCQETPPVAIGKEMYVARKAVELSRAAPSHTTNKEK